MTISTARFLPYLFLALGFLLFSTVFAKQGAAESATALESIESLRAVRWRLTERGMSMSFRFYADYVCETCSGKRGTPPICCTTAL